MKKAGIKKGGKKKVRHRKKVVHSEFLNMKTFSTWFVVIDCMFLTAAGLFLLIMGASRFVSYAAETYEFESGMALIAVGAAFLALASIVLGIAALLLK